MKKSKKGEAKFFCESCGAEVPGRSKVCPVCGKFFASVRCPKCGRTGESEDFKNGCPTCGYAVITDGLNDNSYGQSHNYSDNSRKNKKNKKGFFSFNLGKNNVHQSQDNNDSGLPVWVYILTVLVFIILIICMYICL